MASLFSFRSRARKSEDLTDSEGAPLNPAPAAASNRGGPPAAASYRGTPPGPQSQRPFLGTLATPVPVQQQGTLPNERMSTGSIEAAPDISDATKRTTAVDTAMLHELTDKPMKDMTPAEKKGEQAKAASLRFKLNTPPKATVEVTGVYTDRTANRKYGGRPTADGPIRSRQKKQEGALTAASHDARGRLILKDEQQKKVNDQIFATAPRPPERQTRLPNFTGDWMCSATSGDWDEFLYLLDVPEFTRKLAKARKWGVKHSQQKIVGSNKTSIQIYNHYQKLNFSASSSSPKKGVEAPPTKAAPADGAASKGVKFSATDDSGKQVTSKEGDVLGDPVSLNIDGAEQTITYEGFKGQGVVRWEGAALVTRFQSLGKLGPCVISRKMTPDDCMTVDIYVTYIHCQRKFTLYDDLMYY